MSDIPCITSLYEGRPICWNWSLQDIIRYINNSKVLALQNYTAEDPGDMTRQQSFKDLIDRLLLTCLHSGKVYVPNSTDPDELYVCYVSFHYRNGREIPIGDVYSALGWFMSYSGDTNRSMAQDYKLFVCYTRLCHVIGLALGRMNPVKKGRGEKELFFYPAKTHMLWIESCILFTADPSDHTNAPAIVEHRSHRSFSASLPNDIRMSSGKQMLKNIRLAMIARLVDPDTLGWMMEVKENHVGICAETLTYASFISDNPSTIVVAYGEALTVEKVGPEFNEYQNIIETAHCHPCEACRNLFSHGRVTQQDIGSGRILGPLPPGTQITSDWKIRNNAPLCISCKRPYNPDASYKTMFCKKRCYEHYAGYCAQSQGRFPPSLNITRYAPPLLPPSTWGQNVIPATVAGPIPRPIGYQSPAANWTLYGPPDIFSPNIPPGSGGPSSGPSTGVSYYAPSFPSGSHDNNPFRH